jgi:hypothetical protein
VQQIYFSTVTTPSYRAYNERVISRKAYQMRRIQVAKDVIQKALKTQEIARLVAERERRLTSPKLDASR